MTANAQLNDTCSYQIVPTNSTCSMSSSFRTKTPVLVRAWQKIDLIIFELLKKNVIDVNILDEYIKGKNM